MSSNPGGRTSASRAQGGIGSRSAGLSAPARAERPPAERSQRPPPARAERPRAERAQYPPRSFSARGETPSARASFSGSFPTSARAAAIAASVRSRARFSPIAFIQSTSVAGAIVAAIRWPLGRPAAAVAGRMRALRAFARRHDPARWLWPDEDYGGPLPAAHDPADVHGPQLPPSDPDATSFQADAEGS